MSEPSIGGNAARYLEECLRTNYVSSVGPFVDQFEAEFASYVGAKHAVACSTGTAALHIALRLVDVRPGDEVLVSTLTFAASANPVLYEHARPVFVDSEATTLNIDPRLVVQELERRAHAGLAQPKAVEVVHLLGRPADIAPIADACERYGVAVLEDAAESLGARYTSGALAGQHVGTVGQVGCFSFNGNKVITTGGGGMIVTDNAAMAARARHLTTQAKRPGAEYWHDEVGYNYRLTNLGAALGLAQLEQLPEFLERKRRVSERYDEVFRGQAGMHPWQAVEWAQPSWWLYTLRIDPPAFGTDRKDLQRELAECGVEARPLWTPLHLQPIYKGAPCLGDGLVSERVFADHLSLPSSVGLTPARQQRVISAVRDVARRVRSSTAGTAS